jgi:hypothetical protein
MWIVSGPIWTTLVSGEGIEASTGATAPATLEQDSER